ncbi:MAG: DUF551 domain-containing protein [Clostridia bacterium]|nr:DUF551 domain-containing protein [Clostridia bacterium]
MKESNKPYIVTNPQIEEMAKVIEITEQIARDAHCGYPSPRMYATDLYRKGWRKQEEGEWISVEDRLPETEKILSRHDGSIGVRSIRVLCTCRQKNGKIFVKEGYYEKWDVSTKPYWRIPGSIDTVTHWMPLPEPPKMKGE